MTKNRNDIRYLHSEKKLVSAFLMVARKVGLVAVYPREITRRAGLAISTFYRHHRNLQKMVECTERRVIRKYEALLERVEASGGQMDDFIDCTTEYILKNFELFQTAAKFEYVGVYRKMVMKLWKYIGDDYVDYGEGTDDIVQVYCYEMIGVLIMWAGNGGKDKGECNRKLKLLSRKYSQRLSFMIK